MEPDTGTEVILLVEQDLVDTVQSWNLAHPYGYVRTEFLI